MRHLSNKVNIVPVIAKADCLTQAEIGTLKRKILQEIQDNDIKIYSLPEPYIIGRNAVEGKVERVRGV